MKQLHQNRVNHSSPAFDKLNCRDQQTLQLSKEAVAAGRCVHASVQLPDRLGNRDARWHWPVHSQPCLPDCPHVPCKWLGHSLWCHCDRCQPCPAWSVLPPPPVPEWIMCRLVLPGPVKTIIISHSQGSCGMSMHGREGVVHASQAACAAATQPLGQHCNGHQHQRKSAI